MSRPRTAQSRESLGSITSCLSAFSLRSSQSSIDYGDGRRPSNVHIEGIFKIEGKCFDVMLKDSILKWSPVSLDPNSDEIETFELDIKSVCVGLRIRKLKSLRNHKSVIAGFSILIMNWDTGKESNITFNNDDQDLILEWSNKLMKLIRRRPLGKFKEAKIFIQNEDELPSHILATLQAAGLKIRKMPLAEFRDVKFNELCILIGSDDFFQFAIEYSLPRSTLAFIPMDHSPLAKHFYGSIMPRGALLKLIFGEITRSCPIMVKLKHLDGKVISKKTIMLRIDPTSSFSSTFQLDGKVRIENQSFDISTPNCHRIKILSNPEKENNKRFRMKVTSSSGAALINQAIVSLLPRSVVQSVGSCEESSMSLDNFSFKMTNLNGKYKIKFGSIEMENIDGIKSVTITGDPDLNFTHFVNNS